MKDSGPDIGRSFVLIKIGSKKLSTAYARFKVEILLGRRLRKDEVVHHIDKDVTNDRIENLQVLDHNRHAGLSRKLQPIGIVCQVCGKPFVLEGTRLSNMLGNHKRRPCKGPFCSRVCTGYASHFIDKYVEIKMLVARQY